MKKWLCLLLAALTLLGGCALAEGAEGKFTLRFEEGFSLTLPEGWVSYGPLDENTPYALGDGEGRYLYVQLTDTEFDSFEALQGALDGWEGCTPTSALNLNGQTFAAFILPEQNAGGCATVLNGRQLTVLFTPQSDTEFTVAVAEIMASFTLLD